MAHILIVEDDWELREAWSGVLKQTGNMVHTAGDGLEGMRQVGDRQYDLVIFDLNLPRLSGIEAIKLIRRTDRNLPILAVTASKDSTLVRSVIAVGANDILFKPFDIDVLTDAVARLARQQSQG